MSRTDDVITQYMRGTPDAAISLDMVFRDAYRTATGQRRARLGFAFASDAGLDILLGGAQAHSQWESTEKDWIVGLHRLITQPAAIRRIRLLPNSRVKVFVGGSQMSLETLLWGQHCHAKIMAFDYGADRRTGYLVASSANLTESAYGSPARNYEAGLAVRADFLPAPVIADFDRWWGTAWNASLDATDELLNKYVSLRRKYLVQNPDAFADLGRPSTRQIVGAEHLWIEAGAMQGIKRNGVEFSQDLAGFFGPVLRGTRDLRIAFDGGMRDDRPLSYKTTTFGVEIWRLSLPTESQGGPVYAGRVIQFRKAQDQDGILYHLDVTDLNSRKHQLWRGDANRQGYLGSTIRRGQTNRRRDLGSTTHSRAYGLY